MAPGDSPAMLPGLRRDLAIEAAGTHRDGSARHVIHDRIKERYIAVGEEGRTLMLNWCATEPALLADAIARTGARRPQTGEILEFARFLFANNLTAQPPGGDPRSFAARSQTFAASATARAFGTSLFLKMPLWRPQAFLDRLAPWVDPLFSRTALVLLALLSLADLYLVSHQWEAFSGTFAAWRSWNGVLTLGAGLSALKVAHELGHALMARRFGVPVPVAGIALMLFVPVLYADTSGSWRLAKPHQRLLIDAAGVMAELAIAVLATMLWVLLEDGPSRSLMFVLATASWITSLAVNLNPFMKFDGYYIFAELIGVENLQERSFARLRWRLRKMLFGTTASPPEILPPARARTMLAYAMATMAYRMLLQIGIAALLYTMAPKVLALPLAAFSLTLGIALPVKNELSHWWSARTTLIKNSTTRRTALMGSAVLVCLFIPLPVRVHVPAIMHSQSEAQIFSGESGRIIAHSIVAGRKVTKSEILLRLESPDLDHELALAQIRLEAVTARLRRIGADKADLAASFVLLREQAAARSAITSLLQRKQALLVLAPFDGIIANADPVLAAGQWLDGALQIGLVYQTGNAAFSGLIAERHLERATAGNAGRFIADDPMAGSVAVRLVQISALPAKDFAAPELADTEGGLVPVADGPGLNPAPHGSWFPVIFHPQANAPLLQFDHVVRGVVVLEGGYQSFAAHGLIRIFSVLVRESGF